MSKAMEAARDALKGDFIGKYMSDDYREEVARIAVQAYLAAVEAEGAPVGRVYVGQTQGYFLTGSDETVEWPEGVGFLGEPIYLRNGGE